MLELELSPHAEIRGTVVMDEGRCRRIASVKPGGISIIRGCVSERNRIERFIESTYQRHFGAGITHHYPTLMCVYDVRGDILAAVGLRRASDGPVFLEHYLGSAVETHVARVLRTPVNRDAIVEIGNLASAGKGASVYLAVALAAYLRRRRFGFAVATANRSVRRSLAMLGVEFRDLGPARAASLPDGGANWGSYFTGDPVVIAGAVYPALRDLEACLPPGFTSAAAPPGSVAAPRLGRIRVPRRVDAR